MKNWTTDELEELRKRAIKDITPELPDMPRAAVVELLALESEESNPRETLVAALSARIEKHDADDTDEFDAADKPEAAAPPAYQAEDYTGPLTIEQATWRSINLKPVDRVITK